MLRKKKLFKICTVCWEIIIDVLNEGKFCKRDTECENVKQEIYWMWENFVKDVLDVSKFRKRCTECVNIM